VAPQSDPFDKWWPRLRDVGAAVFGVYLMQGAASQPSPNVAVLTLGFALLVVPVASLAQKYLRGKLEDDEP
jgi:hypothetical protein